MAKRSPMVSIEETPAKFLSSSATMVITIIAMSEPGIFLLNFGVMAIMAMLATPVSAHQMSVVLKFCRYTPHFSMKSEGFDGRVRPKRSFICVVKMVTAIPLVKPTTMG